MADNVDKDFIQTIAARTEGFSGRELFKMVVAWHDAAFANPDPVLTQDLMNELMQKFKYQHEQKQHWSKDEAKILEKLYQPIEKISDPAA
jgi:ATPase family AAA domain-containing protein 3A/B